MTTRKLLYLAVLASCQPTSSLETSRFPKGVKTGGAASRQLAYAMHAQYQAQAERVAPPLGLEPSDGSELALRSLEATVSINGPIARTELHFSFRNTENRQREGRFRIELPDGAAVSRFAMLVGDQWREARVVSRLQGRQVYETFLHKRVDPALLEQDLGNQFSARVFPIPASSDKEIVIAYDHPVSAAQPYTLALRGLPAIPKLSIAIEQDGKRTVTERSAAVPEDLIVGIEAGDVVLAGGGSFVARVDAPAATDKPASLDGLMILVDTSASRDALMGKQADLVQRLVAALPPDTAIKIATYDQATTELYAGPARDAVDIASKLYEHGALGASDLGAALARAANAGVSRLVIIGDGVATIGETSAAALAARLRDSGILRIDAIQVGGSLARDTLGPITQAGKQPGAILESRDVPALVRALSYALPSEVPISVEGATAVWPKTTRGAMPGRPLFVTGHLPAGSREVAIKIGQRVIKLAAREGDSLRVGRAAGRAEVGDLGDQLALVRDPGKRLQLEQKIERIALANNLVSSQTSLLVLESDADERLMLGDRAAPPRSPQGESAVIRGGDKNSGEVIRITSTSPTIDPTSTTQGITIDKTYIRNIPSPGRTFESALGAAAGAQADGQGVRFSGSTSIENHYVVDGINTTGVATDTMSPLGLDQMATYLKSSAFVFGLPRNRPRATPSTAPLAFTSPYVDQLAEVMTALATGKREQAMATAAKWRGKQPGDLAALMALGESLEASGAKREAERAYGSILDLYPNRFELARAAGERFDRLGSHALAVDAYRRALKERPDQLSTYRLLAFALLRVGKASEALDRLMEARGKANNSVREILLQDARVIAAHIVAREPGRAAELKKKLGGPIPRTPSLHMVLGWETDATDVDLHIVDRLGAHAFYSQRTLPSGGSLLDDLTDGYGPEMFSIEKPTAFPYSIAVHYYNRGPMGLGIGTVQVIKHDGNGTITVDDRPFVLQTDGATIPLGEVR